MRPLLFAFLLTVASVTSYGQNNEPDPTRVDIVPPAPEAAALGKFVDMPVSLYTGTPQIDIPIYTLASYELQVPIMLKYHASGLKVDDLPSSVGAGWALSAASTVSRTMNIFPDESDLGYMSDLTSGIYAMSNFFNQDGTINESYITSNANVVGQSNACELGINDDNASMNIFIAANGGVDLRPDEFFFTLPSGESAKFYFNREGEIETLDQSPIELDYLVEGDLIVSWIITGIDGTKYYYGQEGKYNSSVVTNPCKGDGELIVNTDGDTETLPVYENRSTWHLTKIESASVNDRIDFIYQQENLSYNQTISITEYERYYDGPQTLIGPQTPDPSFCSNDVQIGGFALQEIQASNGYRVVFNRNDDRQDLSGGKELDEIKIYYKNEVIKSFRLSHSYANNLLMLDEIKECDGPSPCLPPYTFNYYSFDGPRNSLNTDHWGYYNGAINNRYAPEMIYNGRYYQGADREPDFLSARQGTLFRITYPTGGTTDFEYELHRYRNYTYDQVYNFDPQLTSLASLSHIIEDDPSPNSYTDQDNFTLSQPTDVILIYTLPEVAGGGIPGEVSFTLNSPNGFSQTYVVSGLFNPPVITLPAGSYTLSLDFQPWDTNWQGQSVQERTMSFDVLKIEESSQLSQSGGFSGGGLRVKRIVKTGSNAFEKNFVYENEVGRSSGQLISFPNYVNEFIVSTDVWNTDGIPFCEDRQEYIFLQRTSTSNVTLSTTSGSTVGYDQVTVYEGPILSNSGYTVHRYSNVPDELTYAFGGLGIRTPARSFSYKNGLLYSSRIFRNDGKLLRLDSNTYSFNNQKEIGRGLQINLQYSTPCKLCEYYQYTYGQYTQPSERVLKTKSFSWVYDQKFDGRFETLSEFNYTAYNQISSKRTTTSRNDWTRVTEITYNSTDHTLPRQIVEYYENGSNKQFIRSVEKTFNSVIKPTQVRIGESENQNVPNPVTVNRIPRLNYGDYNAVDKPLSYQKSDDIQMGLIWGYDDTFLIAQASNASDQDIAYCSFEEDQINGNWVYTAGTANLNVNGEAPTGKKVLSAAGIAVVSKPTVNSNLNHVVSFWAQGSGNIIINSSITVTGSSDWKYYSVEVPAGPSTINIQFNSHKVDELRCHPVGSQMTTYCYDPINGVSAISDPNSKPTIYSYDEFNRLDWIKDIGGAIVEKYEYIYDSSN